MERFKIKTENVLEKLIYFTIFFNITFPKAGIKISGIPLTIGNIFLACTFLLWIVYKSHNNSFKVSKVGLALLVMICYYALKYLLIGNYISNIGYIVPLVVYPIMYYIIFDFFDNKEKITKVIKLITVCFFIISSYALLQYFVGIEKCAIPGLTVNYTDYIKLGKYWYLTKANGVEIANSKIVSTYQNGNLFGINMLLIYPLVYYYLKNKYKVKTLVFSLVLFIASVFLSLSRACWLGICLFVLFAIIMDNAKNKKSVSFKILVIIFAIFSVVFVFNYMPSVINRFTKTKMSDWISMSGRTKGLMMVIDSVFKNNSNVFAWLFGPSGIIEFYGLAYEMFPLSIFAQGGFVGMILIYYVIIKSLTKITSNNYYLKAIRISLLIWIIVGIIESGFWLPPLAINLFMLIGLGNAIKIKQL